MNYKLQLQREIAGHSKTWRSMRREGNRPKPESNGAYDRESRRAEKRVKRSVRRGQSRRTKARVKRSVRQREQKSREEGQTKRSTGTEQENEGQSQTERSTERAEEPRRGSNEAFDENTAEKRGQSQ